MSSLNIPLSVKVAKRRIATTLTTMQLTKLSFYFMSLFRFEHRPERKELLVFISTPQFTAATVPEFKVAFESAWKPEISRVVLDLSTIEFMDSSGVGALLGVQKRLSSLGEPLTLKGARPAVVGVIELLRLQRVFKME
jgi:anti-sigma B factor antagonist